MAQRMPSEPRILDLGMGLQRHCAEDWNQFAGILIQCLSGERKKDSSQVQFQVRTHAFSMLFHPFSMCFDGIFRGSSLACNPRGLAGTPDRFSCGSAAKNLQVS